MRMNQKRFSYQKILQKEPLLYELSASLYEECTEAEPVRQDTCYVLAPLVFCFTAWVLRRAEREGIQRLYFLARDGYQFYRCALRLCEGWKLPLECRYLECSRYSLRIPMFHRMGEESLEYICMGGIDVTFRKVMHRAGIGGEEAVDIGRRVGFADRMDECMTYQQVQALKQQLKKCRGFMERVSEVSMKAYPAAESYLRQEGMYDNVPYALVDSGWTGSMQKILQEMLQTGGKKNPLCGFYWGLYELPKDAEEDRYYPYYFKMRGDYRRKVYFSNCLFEAVFSAPHGMTLSYEYSGDRVISCYDHDRGNNAGQIEKQTEWMLRYIEKVLAKKDMWTEEALVRAANTLYVLLKSFMGKPDREEAEWYGAYQFSDDVLEDSRQSVAAALTRKELQANHVLSKCFRMYGIRKGPVRESAWYEASAVLSGGAGRWHRQQYRWYKYLLYVRKNIKRGNQEHE